MQEFRHDPIAGPVEPDASDVIAGASRPKVSYPANTVPQKFVPKLAKARRARMACCYFELIHNGLLVIEVEEI
jgi:hypothetical protein